MTQIKADQMCVYPTEMKIEKICIQSQIRTFDLKHLRKTQFHPARLVALLPVQSS